MRVDPFVMLGIALIFLLLAERLARPLKPPTPPTIGKPIPRVYGRLKDDPPCE